MNQRQTYISDMKLQKLTFQLDRIFFSSSSHLFNHKWFRRMIESRFAYICKIWDRTANEFNMFSLISILYRVNEKVVLRKCRERMQRKCRLRSIAIQNNVFPLLPADIGWKALHLYISFESPSESDSWHWYFDNFNKVDKNYDSIRIWIYNFLIF